MPKRKNAKVLAEQSKARTTPHVPTSAGFFPEQDGLDLLGDDHSDPATRSVWENPFFTEPSCADLHSCSPLVVIEDLAALGAIPDDTFPLIASREVSHA